MKLKILVLLLLTLLIEVKAQTNIDESKLIVDSTINMIITFTKDWKKMDVSNSISQPNSNSQYVPIIHLESTQNKNSNPGIKDALIVLSDSKYNPKIVLNESDYLNQIKKEMEAMYGYNPFGQNIEQTKIDGKLLYSLKGSISTMGYSFFEEIITTFYHNQYITMIILYNNVGIRNEIISFIHFIK